MRYKIGIFVVILSATLSYSAEDSSAALKAVTSGYKDYSWALYDILRKSTEDNLIVSPISLASVMAMLQAGARGSTSESIRYAMKFPVSDSLLHAGYSSLLDNLRSDENVTIEMANKLYPASGYRLNPSFTKTLRDYYQAEPQQLDFSHGLRASQAINSFVTHFTRNRIQQLVSPNDVNGFTKLMLVNAIYFKGTWKYKFPQELTIGRDFHVSPDDVKPAMVDMMHLHSDNGIFHGIIPDLSAKCVVLPYRGDRLSMIVILPERRYGLQELEQKLMNYNLDKIMDHMHGHGPVSVYLPKFKLRQKMHLRAPLMALGAEEIFSEKADFSGIPASSERRRSISVSDVIQEAYMEVDEEGSETSAATTVGKKASGGFSLYADHAFYAIITANVNMSMRGGTKGDLIPLFSVRVTDPRM